MELLLESHVQESYHVMQPWNISSTMIPLPYLGPLHLELPVFPRSEGLLLMRRV